MGESQSTILGGSMEVEMFNREQMIEEAKLISIEELVEVIEVARKQNSETLNDYETVLRERMEDIRNDLIEMIKDERMRQDEKWGFPQYNNLFQWVSILVEEVGEFAQAVNDACFKDNGEKRFAFIEALQISAVALSIMEHMRL